MHEWIQLNDDNIPKNNRLLLIIGSIDNELICSVATFKSKKEGFLVRFKNKISDIKVYYSYKNISMYKYIDIP